MIYKVGTRGSKLALAQTNAVCEKLKNRWPENEFQIVIVKTAGDIHQNKPLSQIGGKGLFVREIEEMLLRGEIDFAVHSMKDMPAELPEGLYFSKVWGREDPRDVLILREKSNLSELPKNAVIATGSNRRAHQLLALRPDLKIVDIRGNVETRIRKMNENGYDGIVLAAAGLKRVGLESKISQYLSEDEMISSPAQGALALEVCKNREELILMLEEFADEKCDAEVTAERMFLTRMGGGCRMPVGALCCMENENDLNVVDLESRFRLRAMYGREDGSRMSRVEVIGRTPEEAAIMAEKKIREEIAGKVYLVGAGPGDPELITVKGLNKIKEADCIVYDRLISPVLLNSAKPDCEMVYVGKENHNHTMHQGEINALLAEKAMQYDTVVRLKGGDPYVFGRGGEEALYLIERGISVEVINGVSSCIAGPALAGIPVTHRGISGGFEVVTAHNRNGEFSDVDFAAKARSNNTQIYLMGLSKVKEICDSLMENGMRKDFPAAVIAHAAMDDQQTIVGTVENIAKKVEEAGATSPAIIVVGECVRLTDRLALSGETLYSGEHLFKAVTPEVWVPRIGRNRHLARKLAENGIRCFEPEVGRICFVDYKEPEPGFDWLVFTSKNGAEGFCRKFAAAVLNEEDKSKYDNLKIASVGKKTSEMLRQYGFEVTLEPEMANAVSLYNALKACVKPTEIVVYPGGTSEGILEKKMPEICDFKKLVVYENMDVSKVDPLRPGVNKLSGNHLASDAVGVFSCASNAERFSGLFDEAEFNDWKEHGTAFSIGPSTTRKLAELGVKNVVEAASAEIEVLATAVLETL